MSLLGSIGGIVGAATKALSDAAVLTRNGTDYDISASRHRAKLPARAGHTRQSYDALIRIHGLNLPVTPAQNDTITLDGSSWIVWRLLPSAGGSHIMAECMAPPIEVVTPQIVGFADDGGGGKTMTTSDQTPFLAKIMAATDEKVLSVGEDDQMSRLVMKWPHKAGQTEITTEIRVKVRGLGYAVKSVGINDENPEWRRAVLALDT